LEEGIVVTQDYQKAAFYYKTAAIKGNAEGQFRYGRMLEKGRGVRRNMDKAVQYYILASENGHK
jgi:TPR repeat protein